MGKIVNYNCPSCGYNITLRRHGVYVSFWPYLCNRCQIIFENASPFNPELPGYQEVFDEDERAMKKAFKDRELSYCLTGNEKRVTTESLLIRAGERIIHFDRPAALEDVMTLDEFHRLRNDYVEHRKRFWSTYSNLRLPHIQKCRILGYMKKYEKATAYWKGNGISKAQECPQCHQDNVSEWDTSDRICPKCERHMNMGSSPIIFWE